MSPADLIARFTAEDPQWRFAALARLVALGPAAVPALLEAARRPEVAVRVHSVQALGRLRDERALAVLIAALGEQENRGAVAIAAERALSNWGPSCAGAVSDEAIHGAPAARPRAVRVLGKLGGEAAVFIRLLGDPEATVRLQAAEALVRVDPAAARVQLPALLEDPVDFVRLGVAEGLVLVGSALGAPVLARALEVDETHAWAEDLLEELASARREGRLA